MRGWVNSVVIFRRLVFVKCKQKQTTPKMKIENTFWISMKTKRIDDEERQQSD